MISFKNHTVVAGDNLFGIIRKYYGEYDNRILNMILEYNDIKDPSSISVGSVIRLPGNWGGGNPTYLKIEDVKTSDEEISVLVNKGGESETPTVGGKPKIFEKPLMPKDYWKEKYHKDLIVLHFTAGYSWESAYATFKKDGRVATPFVVDVDGKIYRLFDEKYWAYHLGVKGVGGSYDKRSIGIEIVNIGPVWNKGGVWKDYVGKTHAPEQIVVGKNRDAQGGVKFPKEQVNSVYALVNDLIVRFGIPRQVVDNPMECQIQKTSKFKGVLYHQTLRQDKYDMGVAWDFEDMVKNIGLKKVKL